MRFDRGMRLFKYFIQIFTNVPRLNRETLSDSNRANEFSPLLPIIEMAFVVIIMYMFMFMFKGKQRGHNNNNILEKQALLLSYNVSNRHKSKIRISKISII